MRSVVLLLTVLFLVVGGARAHEDSGFDTHFADHTLRVDFFQFGDGATEMVGLDRLIRQGVWAGPTTNLIGASAYGRHAVKVVDQATGDTLFERGFDSYFGEYRTSKAALEGAMKAYHNTVLVPFPRHPVRLIIEDRRVGVEPAILLAHDVDPTSIEIASEPTPPDAMVIEAHRGGEPHSTLDIAIVGEGYRADEVTTFRADLARFTSVLLGQEPYHSNSDRIAVRGVLLPSAESGADEPTMGRYRSTTLGVTFNSLGSERYMLTEDNRSLRDIAGAVPYDTLVIMVNHDRYGGGGIYNAYCTFTAHSEWAEYLLLHEFGHSFAGLADEYYTSDVAYSDFYPPGTEPAEANITALTDPDRLKWRHLVTPGTPIPTPWNKAAFDERSNAAQKLRREINERLAQANRDGASAAEIAALEMERDELARTTSEWVKDFLAATANADRVGAFEGAGYASQGLYRPAVDCLMFRRGVQPFCPVCEEAVSNVIRSYAP